MVEVRKEQRGNKTYYYLEHSLRKGKKVRKERLYVGETLPPSLNTLKRKFSDELFTKRWLPEIEGIKRAYHEECIETPRTAQWKELESFMIGFTYDTQRMEGSTLTLRETANLLEQGITPFEKPVADVKEAEAHKNVFYEMINNTSDLTLQVVLQWHRHLFMETKQDIAGKIRTHQVRIAGSTFMPPRAIELETMLREFFVWYKHQKDTTNPVELAALVHLKFVTIHPFSDGNGRISRLMMNFVLKRHKCPLFTIRYGNRNAYYTSLERAQKKEESIFVHWFIKEYVKTTKKYFGL